jgi:hypothetical protein
MVGGRLAFAQGGYTGTPIEDIVPISLRQGRNDYRTVAQRMVLTPEGAVHPITRLSADTKENQRIWNAMPELDALNVASRAKPGATVLGISSDRFGDTQSTPLLAIQRFGKGRTLALLSDYIWKWNFHMAGRTDSNQYYLQFVRQMVRWLIRDPILKQVRVMADANEFPIGSEITGTVQALQDDYRREARNFQYNSCLPAILENIVIVFRQPRKVSTSWTYKRKSRAKPMRPIVSCCMPTVQAEKSSKRPPTMPSCRILPTAPAARSLPYTTLPVLQWPVW